MKEFWTQIQENLVFLSNMKELWTQIQENLVFLGISVGIVVILFLASAGAERLLPARRKVSPARRVSIVAVCAAIATVLHVLDFPLLFLAPEFYKVDFSELPVLLCGFFLGPSSAVACEAVKILLKLLLKGTSTAFVGDFANFVVGCSLVIPASLVYHTHKTKKTALLGLALGCFIMTVFGSIFKAVYLLPKFSQLYGIPLDAIIAMGTKINGSIHNLTTLVVLAVAPLNLIKSVTVSILTMLLYKRVARPLFRAD